MARMRSSRRRPDDLLFFVKRPRLEDVLTKNVFRLGALLLEGVLANNVRLCALRLEDVLVIKCPSS
jgi:hypothetical protein